MSSNLNILLFGMGGIGSTYAFLFQQAGASVHVVARSNQKTLSENGLSIDSVKFGKKEGVKFASVSRSAEDAQKGLGEGNSFDYVVCTYDNSTSEVEGMAGRGDGREKRRRQWTATDLGLAFVSTFGVAFVGCTKALLKDPKDSNALENLIAPAVTEGKTAIVIIQNGVGSFNDFPILVTISVRKRLTQTR
jgi:hypothetical protein